MHTFLINTTSIEEYDKFKMILYKDIHDFKLTVLNEKLSDLSKCVKSIEEDVNKELAIRENFNIILIVELRARSMENIENINRYKEQLIFYIQNELINPLLIMGFRPGTVGLIFLENYKNFYGNEGEFKIDEASLIESSIGLWPWKGFEIETNKNRDKETQEFLEQTLGYLKSLEPGDFFISLSDQKMKSFFTALERRFVEEKEADKTLADSVLNNPEELMKFVGDEYHTYEINNHFHGFELENYKYGSLDIFNKSPEDKDTAIFSSLLTVQEAVEQEKVFENYEINLLDRTDSNIPHQLVRYYQQLERVINTINPVNHEPILGFSTTLKDNQHLTIKDFDKEFKKTTLDNVQCYTNQSKLPKILFSEKDVLECEKFLSDARADIDEDLRLLEKGIREILRDFHENAKAQIDSTIMNKGQSLYDDDNEIKLDERSLNDYEDELNKERADLKVKMEQQNLEAIHNNAFQTAFDDQSAKVNYYISCLEGVRALTYVFIICLAALAVTLPSILVHYLDDDLSRSIAILYILGPAIIIFLLLYFSVNSYRKKLFEVLKELQELVKNYEEDIIKLYQSLYNRYDTYIPGLTYLNAYIKDFETKREEQRHISQKKIYHREKLKEHMDNSEKLLRVFLTKERMNTPLNDPLKSKDINHDLDIIGNYDVYNFYNKND